MSDDQSDMVVGINMQTGGVVDRIAVAGRPRGMIFSPDRSLLYVALSASPDSAEIEPGEAPAKPRIDGVAAIDVATAKVVRIMPAGEDPVRVTISRDGHRLFVANQAGGTITAVPADGNGQSQKLKICETPEGIVLPADGKALFVACVDSNQVAIVDPKDLHVLHKIHIRGGPRAALAAQDGQHVFIATDNGRLAIVSTNGQVEKTLDLTRNADTVRASGITETSNGHLFVTTGQYGAVVEVDPKAGTIVRTIANAGEEPMGVGLSADGTTLVTANGASGDISLINRLSGKIVRKLNVGKRAWSIAAYGG